jgi:hypothetical protein
MNKKASILIVGIFGAFFLFILAIFINQVVEQITRDFHTGEDAMKLENYRVASYRHRFFLDNEAKNILSNLDFESELNNKLSKFDSHIILPDKFYLRELAFNFLESQINSKMKDSIVVYNRHVLDEELLDFNYLIDHNFNYSLFEKEGLIYGYASNPIRIRSGGSLDAYYHWPHFKIKNDFFVKLNEPYEAKIFLERCMVLRNDINICEEELNKRFSAQLKVEEKKVILLPEGADEETLVIDSSGTLIVKVNDVYKSSNDLGQTWILDEDSNILVNNPSLYFEYLESGEFKKMEKSLILYFNNFVIILT